MDKDEGYKKIFKTEEETSKFLDKVGKEVMRYFGGNVNKMTVKRAKGEFKEEYVRIKKKAGEYFHEIDRYLTPEMKKSTMYKSLIRAKENLGIIATD